LDLKWLSFGLLSQGRVFWIVENLANPFGLKVEIAVELLESLLANGFATSGLKEGGFGWGTFLGDSPEANTSITSMGPEQHSIALENLWAFLSGLRGDGLQS
jgi:hypothetical protein